MCSLCSYTQNAEVAVAPAPAASNDALLFDPLAGAAAAPAPASGGNADLLGLNADLARYSIYTACTQHVHSTYTADLTDPSYVMTCVFL